jgi:serine/threonine-protein kinase
MVKILDFGISKIVAGTPSCPPAPISESHKVLTQKGIVYGTPGYMAPETLFGTEAVDGRADLFAVAVLLYEMVVGKRPFHGPNPQATMVATASKPAPSLLSFRPEISAAVDEIVTKGLAKDPDHRYQTASDFLYAVVHLGYVSIRPPLETDPAVSLTAQATDDDDGRDAAVSKLALKSLHPPRTTALPKAKPPAPPFRYRDYKQEVALERKRKRRALWQRRISFALSPLTIVFLAGIAGFLYYYFGYRAPVHVVAGDQPIDGIIAGKIDEHMAKNVVENDVQPIATVTVWLDTEPAALTVHLADKLVYERPLIIPEGKEAVEIRFSKEGYVTERRYIVPDQEQTIVVRLKKRRRR